MPRSCRPCLIGQCSLVSHETATLSDVVDAWTEVTIVHALAREALTATTQAERQNALHALRNIGHGNLADVVTLTSEIVP